MTLQTVHMPADNVLKRCYTHICILYEHTGHLPHNVGHTALRCSNLSRDKYADNVAFTKTMDNLRSVKCSVKNNTLSNVT